MTRRCGSLRLAVEVERVRNGSFVVAPGTTTRGTCAPQRATRTIHATPTTTSGSGSPERRRGAEASASDQTSAASDGTSRRRNPSGPRRGSSCRGRAVETSPGFHLQGVEVAREMALEEGIGALRPRVDPGLFTTIVASLSPRVETRGNTRDRDALEARSGLTGCSRRGADFTRRIAGACCRVFQHAAARSSSRQVIGCRRSASTRLLLRSVA